MFSSNLLYIQMPNNDENRILSVRNIHENYIVQYNMRDVDFFLQLQDWCLMVCLHMP